MDKAVGGWLLTESMSTPVCWFHISEHDVSYSGVFHVRMCTAMHGGNTPHDCEILPSSLVLRANCGKCTTNLSLPCFTQPRR